jgi:hypothetical protein
VNVVRGDHATLHVYKTANDTTVMEGQPSRGLRSNNRPRLVEVATVSLSTITSKVEMHQTMQLHGFTMKSDEVRQKEYDDQQRKQQQKNFAMFFRQEYLRQQFYHAYYFRQDVMNDTIYYNNMTWSSNYDHDFLYKNYDHIFKMQVIYKKDIQQYATQYLLQCGRIKQNP